MDNHEDLGDGAIHQISNGAYSNAITKTAASFGSGQVGKVYRQSDDDSYSILLDTTPTFKRIVEGIECRLQTANATETALYTYDASTLDNYVFYVEVRVMAMVSGGGDAATYLSVAGFKRVGGSLSIISTQTDLHEKEQEATWDVQLEASGNNILVNVTGEAATSINWFGVVTIIIMKDS